MSQPENAAPMSRRICFPFVGDTIGGSHFSALLLLRNFDEKRYEPLIVLHEEGMLADHLRAIGLDYTLLPLPVYVGRGRGSLKHAAAILQTASRLVPFLRQRRIDIVHTHDMRMHLTWALPCRLAGRRLVWHQRSKYQRSRLAGLMARLADQVICISHFCASDMPLPSSGRLEVVDNPFELSSAPPSRAAARIRFMEETGMPRDASVIGFVGNLRQQKRPFMFVEAAARIREANRHPVSFAMFGADREGIAGNILGKAHELGLGEDLHFMGFRSPIESWIAACDILLAPEVDDGFGRSLVEAMLMGTPVVASDSGGHREIVNSGTTGLLVPADNAGALADAALTLLTDREYAARISEAAGLCARERFGIDGHVRRVMGIYDQVAPFAA